MLGAKQHFTFCGYYEAMDIFSLYTSTMESLLRWADMTHSMAHVHAGLAIYLTVQFLLRTRRASGIALQAVIGVELVNEIVQRAVYGSWRWEDTSADIALTIFWPSALYLLSVYRRQRWARWQARVGRGEVMQHAIGRVAD